MLSLNFTNTDFMFILTPFHKGYVYSYMVEKTKRALEIYYYVIIV
jgi:hypothetical protein